MTLQAVHAVIVRAVQEEKFRKELFANPEEALSGYDLSETESAALKSLDAETLDSVAGPVDERLSKSLVAGIMVGAYSAGRKLPQHNRPGFWGAEEGW
jgi:hypothetical protein